MQISCFKQWKELLKNLQGKEFGLFLLHTKDTKCNVILSKYGECNQEEVSTSEGELTPPSCLGALPPGVPLQDCSFGPPSFHSVFSLCLLPNRLILLHPAHRVFKPAHKVSMISPQKIITLSSTYLFLSDNPLCHPRPSLDCYAPL